MYDQMFPKMEKKSTNIFLKQEKDDECKRSDCANRNRENLSASG